jgi:hypothetical protein
MSFILFYKDYQKSDPFQPPSDEYQTHPYQNQPPSPPPPMSNYQQQQQQQPIIIQQPIVVAGTPAFGRYPQAMRCPSCRNQITSVVTFDSGAGTWIACLVLFFIGCDLGCKCFFCSQKRLTKNDLN